MRKGRLLLHGCLVAIGLTATSCSSDNEASTSSTPSGIISLDVINTGTAFTRAVNETDYQNTANYTVQILNNDNEVQKEFLYKDRESSIELKNGIYTFKAFYGTDSNASRDAFYVEGEEMVVVNGDDSKVTITVAPKHGKVVAYFDPTMDTYFSDYSVVYETAALTAAGSVATWAKSETEPWYLKVDEKGEEVKATINFTRIDDSKTSTIEKTYTLLPNKAWTLNIYPKDNNGSLGIELVINEGTNDEEIDITVPSEWI